MSLIETQLERLKEVRNGATLTQLPEGPFLAHIPHVSLSAAWSRPSVSVWFLVPVGYPQAAPDCFWAEAPLTLASGAPPQASNLQLVPGLGQSHVWFSWHVQKWNPNRDTLVTWLRLIEQRLNDPR